jgi:hypothetical protein
VKASTTEAASAEASAAEASTTEARKPMIAFYAGCPAVVIASENAVVACVAALLKSR